MRRHLLRTLLRRIAPFFENCSGAIKNGAIQKLILRGRNSAQSPKRKIAPTNTLLRSRNNNIRKTTNNIAPIFFLYFRGLEFIFQSQGCVETLKVYHRKKNQIQHMREGVKFPNHSNSWITSWHPHLKKYEKNFIIIIIFKGQVTINGGEQQCIVVTHSELGRGIT